MTAQLIPAALGKINLSGRYDLYVDGSPGPKVKPGWSGWGMALMSGALVRYEQCGFTAERVSSNAAELEAIIQGLGYLSRLGVSAVTPLWTDSHYAASEIGRLPETAARGYLDAKGKPVANAGRLELLFELLYPMGLADVMILRWVKGHDKTPGNELADKLSKEAAYKGHAYYKEHPEPPAAA